MRINEIKTGIRISYNGCKGTIAEAYHNWYGDLVFCKLIFDDTSLIPNTMELSCKEEWNKLILLDNLDQCKKIIDSSCSCGAAYTSFKNYHLRYCDLYKDKTIV